jgi:general secretion pathway protein M
MMRDMSLKDLLLRSPLTAMAIYVMAVAIFVFSAWSATASFFERQAAVSNAAEVLARLEGRASPRRGAAAGQDEPNNQSAFLEGATQTVAGATLLQRIGAAVSKVGGNTLSSQVELQDRQSKTGFISVTASCEIEQAGVQKLLYDLEAGMPFLFVDQLVVQSPVSATNSAGGKLRVLIRVSGRWRGAS